MTHVLRKGERVSSIVVFIAIIGMSIWSSTYEGRQATFPLIVCASLVVLGLLDLFLGHRAKAQAPTEAKEEENEGHPVARQLVSIGWLVGFLGGKPWPARPWSRPWPPASSTRCSSGFCPTNSKAACCSDKSGPVRRSGLRSRGGDDAAPPGTARPHRLEPPPVGCAQMNRIA
jgi:hypothetical protein